VYRVPDRRWLLTSWHSDEHGEGTRGAAAVEGGIDDGYGDTKNVTYTVRSHEAPGVQALCIEDQQAPKKCGHRAPMVSMSTK